MFCTECGNKMNGEVCLNCMPITTQAVIQATPDLQEIDNSPVPVAKKKKSLLPLVILLSFTTILLIITIVYLYLNNGGFQSSSDDSYAASETSKKSYRNNDEEADSDESESLSLDDMEEYDDSDDFYDLDSYDDYDYDGYVFAGSNTRHLTMDEVLAVSSDELRIGRNEIYARHGRQFNDDELQSYFNSKSWYYPRYTATEFDALGNSLFNNYEISNLELLSSIN